MSGDDEGPIATDPRLHAPTDALAPMAPAPVRLPPRPPIGTGFEATAEMEPPTGPLVVSIPLDRDATPSDRHTLSMPPSARSGPFGPPIRVDDGAVARPRTPSSPGGGRRPLPREPSRPRPPPPGRPVRDYPIARALLRHPEAVSTEDRALSSTVPRAFVRGGIPASTSEPRGSSARADADGMLQEMAEGLLVGGDGAGNSEIRVTLGEEFFGGTELRIQHTADGLTAILRPPDRDTYRILASELPRLRVQLEERGLRVSNLRVEEP